MELASFGFSHKAPKGVDPDSIFDVRALPNPKTYAAELEPRMSRPTHSQASLLLTRASTDLGRNREYKLLTGEDEGLQRAIFETERGQRTFEAFACWVDGHVSRARSLGTPASLRLFVGCKSGQHRSVALLCRFARLRAVETGPCSEVETGPCREVETGPCETLTLALALTVAVAVALALTPTLAPTLTLTRTRTLTLTRTRTLTLTLTPTLTLTLTLTPTLTLTLALALALTLMLTLTLTGTRETALVVSHRDRHRCLHF